MAQGIDATKTPARPSHEAIENKPGSTTMAGKSDEQKMDQVAMQSAKRAENRIKANQGSRSGHGIGSNNLGDTIFTK
jgi:hypothetical protein